MKRTLVKPAAAASLSTLLLVSACGSSGTGEEPSAAGEADSNYPARGERMQLLVPFSAGGTTDTWARVLADGLQKKTDARFMVVNKPGAGGQLAVNDLLDTPKDTSTIANLNMPSGLKYLYPNSQATYSKKDFALLGCTGYTPNLLVAHADSPYKTLQALVDAAKARPGKINVAADGALSDDTVAYANLEKATGTDLNVVVVDGSAEKVTALLGKQIDAFIGGITGVRSQLESKDFTPLAMMSDERSPFLKDVPTAKEQGVDVTSDAYFCLTMATEAPEEARSSLENHLRELTEDPQYEEANAKVGMEVKFLDGEEFSKLWDEQEQVVKDVIKSLE
jgi:tripartite-type tricarboxylate transporter receptor subunit TctC